MLLWRGKILFLIAPVLFRFLKNAVHVIRSIVEENEECKVFLFSQYLKSSSRAVYS